jgi:hypothetical protein
LAGRLIGWTMKEGSGVVPARKGGAMRAPEEESPPR